METQNNKPAPIQSLSYILIIGLLLLTAIEALSVFTGLWRVISYGIISPNIDSENTARVVDTVYRLLSNAQGIMFIPLPFVFALWLYRMNYNLRQRVSKPMEFTPGGAVGWYFVPIANLFVPFRSMRELWRASHKSWDADPAILRWWWGLWLFRGFFDGGSAQFVNTVTVAEDAVFFSSTFIFADLLNVALNLVALRIVTSIWAAYEENYMMLEDTEKDPDVVILELKEEEKSSK